MADQTEIQKSLVEQIFDEMLTVLEGREEFNPQSVESIKRLAKNGDLKTQKVIDGLKSAVEGTS